MYGVDMHIVKVCLTTAWWPLEMILLVLCYISTLVLLWGGKEKEYCSHAIYVTNDLALCQHSIFWYIFLEGIAWVQAYLLCVKGVSDVEVCTTVFI